MPRSPANDAYSVNEDTTLNVAAAGVLANDTDIDGDAADRRPGHRPQQRHADAQRRRLVHLHARRQLQRHRQLHLPANDGTADSNLATVTITVNPVNDAPPSRCRPANDLAADEGDQVTYAFTVSDVDSSSFDLRHRLTRLRQRMARWSARRTITGFGGSFVCEFPDGDATSTVSVQVADDGRPPEQHGLAGGDRRQRRPDDRDQRCGQRRRGQPLQPTLGAITDPGTDTVTSWLVHWGDGSSDTYTSGGVKTHTYADGPGQLRHHRRPARRGFRSRLPPRPGQRPERPGRQRRSDRPISGLQGVDEGSTHTYSFHGLRSRHRHVQRRCR